jgi:2-polyprenyl-3-methyl-5-hydroxy-6-metoxy-1,4-benzoquinol methylase
MQHLQYCPACDSPAGTAKNISTFHSYQKNTFLETQLVECSCGHVFTNPQPSRNELAPFYDVDYHVFADAKLDTATIDRWITSRLRDGRFNHLKVLPGGRYLDIGCGLGKMVAAMSRLGMKAQGIEPSPIAAQKAREAGLQIYCGLLDDAKLDGESFDCISMFHVLEHVPDPVSVLRECCRLLKAGGELVIGVPNYNSLVLSLVGSSWSALDQPRHLHLFREDSMRQVASRANLRVAAIDTESLVEHVESELANWLRVRMLVPRRLTHATKIARPLARRLASVGNRSGRGEAIVARMERVDSVN